MDDHRDASPPASPETPPSRPAWAGIRSGRAWAFATGVAVTALVTVVLLQLGSAPAITLTARDVRMTVEQILASQVPGPPTSALVYDAIVPSLVLVQTGRADEIEDGESPTQGLGTAVVVTAEGDALTALHVVEGRSTITLTFADGSSSEASIVAADPEKDIAVLRPDEPPAVIAPATLGNPASVRIGSEAYIVGHPYGLVGSLSAGVVSGLDRTFRRPENDRVLSGLIQVDAAVNPGNSGGPLLDRRGFVTGIVTALLNPTRESVFIGIGLAVPIDAAGGVAGLPPY